VSLGGAEVLLAEVWVDFERGFGVWLVLVHELRGRVCAKERRRIHMGYWGRGQVFSERMGLCSAVFRKRCILPSSPDGSQVILALPMPDLWLLLVSRQRSETINAQK